MTRIISGRWGGRRLATPPGDGTRPTSDRVREALFSSLVSMVGDLAELQILDLYAGSGALGLEALSRGAAHADLVESDPRVVKVLQRNVAELGAAARVHRSTVERFVERVGGPWDLVFLDPPYAVPTDEVAAVVASLRPALADGAVVVVERSARDEFAWPGGFDALRDKTYGETRLWYGH